MREAVYDELLPGERQRLHETTATVLAAHPDLAGGPEHVRWALLAYHWGAAGEQSNALAASVRAGLEAHKVGALADASGHFAAQLSSGGRPSPMRRRLPVSTNLACSSTQLRATVHRSPARAVALAETTVALLGDVAELERRAAALERLGHYRWAVGDRRGWATPAGKRSRSWPTVRRARSRPRCCSRSAVNSTSRTDTSMPNRRSGKR